MKHGAWLRDAAREHYYLHYRQPDADFIRAERKREPAYLVAVDYAYESRKLDAEWVAQCPIAFVRQSTLRVQQRNPELHRARRQIAAALRNDT